MLIVKTHKINASLFLSLFLLFSTNSFADSSHDDTLVIGNFSNMSLDDWEEKVFSGQTDYKLIHEGKEHFIQAESNQTASALYKKVKININKTPFLNWSWRIDQALPTLDEKSKDGDDYAARIYVVFKTGITPLSANALNYVWSSNDQTNTSWPNPYTEKAIMIPLRSSVDETGKWKYEKANIKEDLIKHFGKAPKHINGVAIMTDTDSSKNAAKATYGDIYFSTK